MARLRSYYSISHVFCIKLGIECFLILLKNYDIAHQTHHFNSIRTKYVEALLKIGGRWRWRV